MFDSFWKNSHEYEQKRKFDNLMDAKKAVMALYKSTSPVSPANELNAVAASFERGRQKDPAEG